MPRVSRQVSDHHRQQLEESAARLFRQRGIRDVSVPQLMADIGLTHGTFYSHFGSKQELATAAVAGAFSRSVKGWSHRITNAETPSVGISKIVADYLSDATVADPGDTCPATAFSIDAGREPADSPIRLAYALGLEEMIATLARSLPGQETYDDAIVTMAAMVGGLALARATAGTALGADIQRVVAARLTATLETGN